MKEDRKHITVELANKIPHEKILEEEEDVMLEDTILKEVSTEEEEGSRISNIKNNYSKNLMKSTVDLKTIYILINN